MSDLREELARALHPIEAVSFDQCDSVTQAIYRKVADGLLPIIERVRAEEREACARVVEDWAKASFPAGEEEAAALVAAIRGRK